MHMQMNGTSPGLQSIPVILPVGFRQTSLLNGLDISLNRIQSKLDLIEEMYDHLKKTLYDAASEALSMENEKVRYVEKFSEDLENTIKEKKENIFEMDIRSMENSQNQFQTSYPQEYPLHKLPTQPHSFRYHPYQQQNSYDRNSQSQVSSYSPASPPQPTPSPSPKQWDKFGYVCESATQLIEHVNVAHPPTPAPHLTQYQQNQHFMFSQHEIKKTEENAQSKILDLDSHKVHQVYQEDEKRQNGDMNGHNPHSITAMLFSWSHSLSQNKFQQD
ncbi:hypothetical protein FQA39_LY12728 [Lamprigera yunnana]|nr:hypothetical protein FQA39_LY12728 [Lamprigera yunnana]